jgi:hypothetical protein
MTNADILYILAPLAETEKSKILTIAEREALQELLQRVRRWTTRWPEPAPEEVP